MILITVKIGWKIPLRVAVKGGKMHLGWLWLLVGDCHRLLPF